MVHMKYRLKNDFILISLSTFVFIIFAFSLLYSSEYQYYKSVYALSEKYQIPNFQFVTGQNPSKQSSCIDDLTGRWQGNDGGIYYIREIGAEIWWLGSNTFKTGEGFTNVMHGLRNETKNPQPIWGQWSDVPMGQTKASGYLGIIIDPTGTKLTKYNSLGDFFGGSEWTRIDFNDPQCMGVLPGTSTGSGGGFIQLFPIPRK